MSTTYAQTIDGNKIYAERSVQDKDGNQIDTTYAKISSLATVATSGDYDDLTNKPTIPSGADLVPSFTLPTDEGKVLTVGSSSTEWATPPSPATKPVVAGNNIVITENANNVSISTTGLQPALPTISGHAGDVLTVNSQGNAIEWAASQGGTQVQADWAETSTSDPSYIQNKPTMNSLAAGSNISITPSGSTVTVAVTGLATVATSGSYADLSNKPTIPTVDQTYDGTSTNAQAGVAIAGELANIEQVPTVTSSDDGKVLQATYSGGSGSYAWTTPSSGPTYSAGTMISLNNNYISVSTTTYITDIQVVTQLPANPVSSVLYLIQET